MPYLRRDTGSLTPRRSKGSSERAQLRAAPSLGRSGPGARGRCRGRRFLSSFARRSLDCGRRRPQCGEAPLLSRKQRVSGRRRTVPPGRSSVKGAVHFTEPREKNIDDSPKGPAFNSGHVACAVKNELWRTSALAILTKSSNKKKILYKCVHILRHTQLGAAPFQCLARPGAAPLLLAPLRLYQA